jgi:hypothetical protein
VKFIVLTYAKSPKKYGSLAGDTAKKFLLRADSVIIITPYSGSTKIGLSTGENIEVSESMKEICKKLGELNING